MDKEIKRILKLTTIPGFKISSEEQKVLDEWKANQKPVQPPKKKKKYNRKKKVEEKNIVLSPSEPSEAVENENTIKDPIKVQNIVRMDEKALNEES